MAEKCSLEDVKEGVTSLPSSPRATFPKSSRILKKGLFKALFEKGSRFRGEVCLIDYLLPPLKGQKLGITASGKTGPAVLRNRFKRLSREAFRTKRSLLPDSCLLGIRPKGKIAPLSLAAFQKDFQQLALLLKKEAHH